MFGSEYFSEDYFAGEFLYQISPPAPPTPVTYQTLVVPCGTRNCTTLIGDQGSDFGTYGLDTPQTPQSPTPIVECRIRTCVDQPPADLETYSLQDALFFNGTPLTLVPECPRGYLCPPGSLQPITYPPGTFVLPEPPIVPGQPIILQMQGCSSLVVITLPPESSQAEINAAAQQVIQLVAAQQAVCDTINPLGGGPHIFPLPSAVSIGNLPQRICFETPFSGSIVGSSATLPISYQIISGGLPTGLSFSAANATTQFITGTPNTPGTFTFIVQATSPGGSGNKQFTMTVIGISTPSPLPNATLDSPYSESLAAFAMSGTLVWSITAGTLPAGLTLNSATGEIFGTPTVEATSNFTATVTNGVNTCSKTFTLTVQQASTGFPDFLYTVLFGNASQLTGATINGFDFLAGQPPDGTTLGSSITTNWTVLFAVGLGYTIAFQGSDTAGPGDAGTYRVTIDNVTVQPFSGFNDNQVIVYRNAVQQYVYNTNTTTGPLFVDVVIADGDELSIMLAVEGVEAPSASYQVTITTVLLP